MREMDWADDNGNCIILFNLRSKSIFFECLVLFYKLELLTEIYLRMKSNIAIPLLLFTFASCGVTKNSSSLKSIDGFNYYEQTSPHMKVQLFGDYNFQPFKEKYFRDIDKRFIKYATLKFDNKTPTILYKAHTTVQPFYSTVCLQYKNCLLDTIFLNDLGSKLKELLHRNYTKFEKIKCGYKDVYKVKYQITNLVNKIYTSHTEYFFKKDEYVYRLLFWTTNSDDTVISDEAEYIIKEIQFD